MTVPKLTSSVADVFQTYPDKAQKKALAIRKLIFETAAELDGVGELSETLKWGEPAYLTAQSKSGSTIRLGWRSSRPNECALYFICSTTLVSDFRGLFDGVLQFEGNRAIRLDLSKPLPVGPLKACIGAALTYHSKKAVGLR